MATPTASVQARWHRFRLAETDASDHASAACYRRSEHVGIAAVIVPKLKFCHVKWKILGADLVECADHAALEDAPKAFNRVGVNRADDIFVVRVTDDLVAVAVDLFQAVVTNPLIGNEQADFLRNGFGHELGKLVAGYAFENAGDDVALAGDCADNRNLAGPNAAASRLATAFAVVLILSLAADERLINLDNTAELRFRRDQRGADFVAHQMGGVIAAEAHHALNLQSADALLTRKHVMSDPKPVAQRLFGVLKDRLCNGGKAIAIRIALAALPVKRLV